MIFEDRINDEYFEWLCELIDSKRFSRHTSYRKLLMHLHNIEFTWFIPHDDNRADDGIQLRRRYALELNDMSLTRYLDGPCSVLEMMVALALRCEENIMDDPLIGDRTSQWFRNMIVNLGLGSMTDDRFDRDYVDMVINRFLDRQYDEDGQGGLFTVRHCDCDLRDVEIIYQLYWYLDELV